MKRFTRALAFFILAVVWTVGSMPALGSSPASALAAGKALPLTASLSGGPLWRASVASDGTQADGRSFEPVLSLDGRTIAFVSAASNLVGDDHNDLEDVFVHDRLTRETARVSLSSDDAEANGVSRQPALSANGRYVAFVSAADNLVLGDTNGVEDVFVRDLETGQTTRVSVASGGGQASGASWAPALSADGATIAFSSIAPDLVTGDTNAVTDIFVHERLMNRTSRVSVATGGAQGDDHSDFASLSADGRYVAFQSEAQTLVSGDTNNVSDIFVHDRLTGVTRRVSVAQDGAQAEDRSTAASISASGRYVAFVSSANNLVGDDVMALWDVFIKDCYTGGVSLVSLNSESVQANYYSSDPSVSADGRYVAFQSPATNLVSGDANQTDDIFVRDRSSTETAIVSVTADGTQGDWMSFAPAIAGDGRFVAFASNATTLVAGDTNGETDIFVRDLGQGEASTTVSVPPAGGSLVSWPDDTRILFAADTFTATAVVTYTRYSPARRPLPAGLGGIDHFFELTAVYTGTMQLASPARPYTVTLAYADAARAGVAENSLALYYWDGSQWEREPSSALDAAENRIVAHPDHLSAWAVLGVSHKLFLPLVLAGP